MGAGTSLGGPLLGGPLGRGPRAKFRWTAFVLAVTSVGAAVPTPLYPIYESRFDFSAGVLGLVFASYTVGVLLTLFLVAPQAERIGRRPLLYVGMILTAAAAAVFVFANGVVALALARLVSGLAVGATTSVATAAMSDLEPHRDQHHVARVAVAANFGGFAIAVLLSGFLVQFAPHPTELPFLLPLLGAAVGIGAVRFLPETAPEVGVPLRSNIQRISVPREIRRPFWVAAGGIAACYSIYGFFAALVPSYLRSGLGDSSPFAAGALVALMFGTAAAIQLATPQIRDRRALLFGFPVLLATLVALVLILPLEAWAATAVVTFVLGAGVGLTFMGSTTLADRICTEDDRDEVLAGFYAAGYLALAVPTIGVAEASGLVGLTEAGVALGTVVAAAVALLYAETLRTPTPPGGGGRPRDPAPTVDVRQTRGSSNP